MNADLLFKFVVMLCGGVLSCAIWLVMIAIIASHSSNPGNDQSRLRMSQDWMPMAYFVGALVAYLIFRYGN